MNQPGNWKTRIYIMGVLGGAAFGLISAYLFARAAEEDAAQARRSTATATHHDADRTGAFGPGAGAADR
jgi:hypothetical protein